MYLLLIMLLEAATVLQADNDTRHGCDTVPRGSEHAEYPKTSCVYYCKEEDGVWVYGYFVNDTSFLVRHKVTATMASALSILGDINCPQKQKQCRRLRKPRLDPRQDLRPPREPQLPRLKRQNKKRRKRNRRSRKRRLVSFVRHEDT
uniref:BTSP n=1 Tax=Argas monolakensis TaxID=34602 RepID=Q09JQ8_ARGMO|nr:BTSP [Argas monolakensis]